MLTSLGHLRVRHLRRSPQVRERRLSVEGAALRGVPAHRYYDGYVAVLRSGLGHVEDYGCVRHRCWLHAVHCNLGDGGMAQKRMVDAYQ